ncbi:DUF2474 domain-containing protein [Corticibacterium sp. UT-5YL-CI-8]|nr:DUF2474 domain-containing protein [Tianweitania sp. UT-5YL-CI-8]
MERQPGPLWLRLAWFVALWAGGVLTVAAVGYGIRVWLI